MSSGIQAAATPDDLHKVEGKAELIGGKIVRFPPACYKSGVAASEIAFHLYDYAKATGRGDVFTSTFAYVVPRLPSGREAFSPDASYYVGPHPDNRMGFIEFAPTFAVEVRDIDDYADGSEAAMAAKRTDYFEAGTLVVWDVDPVAETVAVYRHDDPTTPTVYARGQVAEAEPAVPGWTMAVDAIFGP